MPPRRWQISAVIMPLFLTGCGDAKPDMDLFKSLRADPARCRSVMTSAQNSGIVTRVSGTDITVDEFRWRNADKDRKVSIALAHYCNNAPETGRYEVYVRGLRDGKILATGHNGHYFTH